MASVTMLALVTDAFGGRGGIAQYNRDFLSALAQGDAPSPIFVLPRRAPDPVLPPPGIVQAPARFSRIAYAFHALRTARADVVFCGHLYMVPLAALLARLKGAKLIVQVHGVEAWTRPSAMQRAAVEAADLVLCVSRDTRARVLEWAALAPERVVVVPNTVSEIFCPGDGASLRAKWNLNGRRVLLTVGRIDLCDRYKGHDRVIAALPYLVAQGHDVVYVAIGEGDDIERLKKIAADIGVDDRVRFMGAVAPETLVEAYRAADLFVMPSTGEGFGIVYLEAMACGTPALGLAAGGAVDALADGELGIIANEDDLAATIGRELRSPKRAAGDLALATRARFGWQAFAAQIDAMRTRLLEAA